MRLAAGRDPSELVTEPPLSEALETEESPFF
jgi:hypothetical protein